MTPRAASAMIEERDRRFERALATMRVPDLRAGLPVLCAALACVVVAVA